MAVRIDDKAMAALRNTPPRDKDHLWNWIYQFTGLKLARQHACRHHQTPFDGLASWFLERPSIALALGARGSGKSFTAGLHVHLESRFKPYHGTRVLGGSEAQSRQIYNAIKEGIIDREGPHPFRLNDHHSIASLQKQVTNYRNGSEVEILTCSPKTVRGPHVPMLKLDEVDEIDPELRTSSLGMCMDKHGYSAMVGMTSTWHNMGGPMGELIEQARATIAEQEAARKSGRRVAKTWSFHQYCIFDVLERCPEERSGPYVGGEAGYANCPECPLKKWCHKERDINGGLPLAKLSDGHYGIDALIQKTSLASERELEADYLCSGPRPDGLWFTNFDHKMHVTEDGEYRPDLPVHTALDTGVRTGAVWFQVELKRVEGRRDGVINIFSDYYSEDLTPELHVRGYTGRDGQHVDGLLDITRQRCNDRRDHNWTDPAGKSRNSSGKITITGFANAGWATKPWPMVQVKSALSLIESLLKSADGTVRIRIHPRCKHLIRAIQTYRRAKVKGMFIDHPEEPQHPAENLIDPLKNGLVAVIGINGFAPEPQHSRVNSRRVF